MVGADIAFVLYIVIAMLWVPASVETANELKEGVEGREPLPAMYADLLCALSVALWPIFLALGLIINYREGKQ